jgi:protein transport protein SEC24
MYPGQPPPMTYGGAPPPPPTQQQQPQQQQQPPGVGPPVPGQQQSQSHLSFQQQQQQQHGMPMTPPPMMGAPPTQYGGAPSGAPPTMGAPPPMGAPPMGGGGVPMMGAPTHAGGSASGGPAPGVGMGTPPMAPPTAMGAPPTMMGQPPMTPPAPPMMMGQPGAGAPAMGVGAPPAPQAPMGQPGGMPPIGGGYAPQAAAAGAGYGASFVEDFASLNLAPGGGPGGEPGMDPATFPRPGDDEPRPNMELSCDPKYMRLTCGALPSSPSLKTRFGMPLGCIVQPLHPGDEKEVKTAHFGSSGIVRCRRCRTYINPFVQFTDGGRRFRCNVCALPNEVPVDYFCTLDANGVRRDIAERPELNSGSVEFLASQEYMVRPPMPPSYFFALDVSHTAVNSGFLKKTIEVIKESLDTMSKASERTRIGFLTYDSTLHFYSLKPNQSQPQMMVVAELDDPFCPMPDDLLVNLAESRGVIDAFLDMVFDMYAQTQNMESAMGPAIQAAFMAMSHVGGKLLVFQSCLPTLGAGRLVNRDDTRASTDSTREHLLRGPVDGFFKKTSAECSRQQICVDLYSIAAPYSDLASLAVLPKYTGGELRHYPGFTLEKDGMKYEKELKNNLTRFTAWEAVCRVRCSRGFRICAFNGHFFIRSMDLLALPATDGDKAYGVHIAHDEVVPSTNISYLQCALLYTSAEGERRIRVHTMAVPVVTDIADMYRAVDGGAMSAFMARLGAERTLTVRLQDARDAVMAKIIATLREFKLLNTQAARAFNRLIYPESMKLLPLFIFAALKSSAMRGSARDIPVDQRIASVFDFMSAPTHEVLKILYPTMHALHTMPKEAGTKDEYDRVILPPRTVLAGERIDARGAYLVDDGRRLLLWLGKMLEPSFVSALFGPKGPPSADVDCVLPPEDNDISRRIRAVVADIRANASRARHLALTVVIQGHPSETQLFPYLVEDRGAANVAGASSYAEFLVQLHRSVSNPQR